MNYQSDVVNFFWGGALIGEGCFFENDAHFENLTFLEGRSLERSSY